MLHRKSVDSGGGFTLIELLIVVAIISILAALAVPNFLEAHVRAKVVRSCADLRSVAVALEAYQVDQNDYPYFYLALWDAGRPVPEYGNEQQNFGERSIVTTPLAYIDAIALDTFGEGDEPVDFLSFEALGNAIGHDLGPAVWGARWVLRSRRPDRVFARHIAYDPTNGTTSGGDIQLFGNGVTDNPMGLGTSGP